MIGHAVCNIMPVVAANRIGIEDGQRFYGTSFICDEWGDVIAELGDDEEGVIVATLDLDRAAKNPRGHGLLPRSPTGTLRAHRARHLSPRPPAVGAGFTCHAARRIFSACCG